MLFYCKLKRIGILQQICKMPKQMPKPFSYEGGLFLLMCRYIFCRRHAKMILKGSRKMSLIDISDLITHLLDIHITLTQQTGCLFHTQIAQELSRRYTSYLFHLSVQLRTTDTDIRGQGVDIILRI